MRPSLLVCALVMAGCAVGEDPGSSVTPLRDSSVADSTSDASTDVPKIDSTTTDTGGAPDTSKPDTTAGDTAATDTALDTAAADTAGDTGAMDTGKADTGTADTGTTDTGTLDTGTTDTGTTDGGACVIQGCTTGSTDRLTCPNARTIGRKTAGTLAGGYAATITMLPATSSITDGTITCLALGPDHAYKLFMRKGETVTVTLADAAEAGVAFNTLFWESGDCASNTCAGSPTKCGSSTGGTYGATADGWVTIMVSGQTPFDFGSYSIKAVLSCKATDCECP